MQVRLLYLSGLVSLACVVATSGNSASAQCLCGDTTNCAVAPFTGTLPTTVIDCPGATADPAGAENPLVGGPQYIEAWVHPLWGNDSAASPGCPDRPYLTINAAVQNVASLASADVPGIVHLSPGIYASNFAGGLQCFPIRLREYVSIQGAGAKECVIRGENAVNKDSCVYFPQSNTSTACECGTRLGAEVLVDACELLGTDLAHETFIDGVTFQGGDVQVYLHGEGETRLRISNCVFDMLDYSSSACALDDGASAIVGPYFGLLIVNRWIGNPGKYWEFNFNILNNTFIQGWVVDAEGCAPGQPWIITSRLEAVAICDVNDPVCTAGASEAPPGLSGVSKMNVQNNLVRYAPYHPRMPFLGLDSLDTSVQIGTRTGPTNAFDDTLYPAGTNVVDSTPGTPGVDCTFKFCVARSSKPVAAVIPRPALPGETIVKPTRDPAFVGEMLSQTVHTAPKFARDWRLLPGSVLTEAGSFPTTDPSDPTGPLVLKANNGAKYVEPSTLPAALLALSSFDFDGEGYGNARLNGSFPDIGFDEVGRLIHAGYVNDGRCFGAGSLPFPLLGTSDAPREYRITFSNGTIRPLRTVSPISLTGFQGSRYCGSSGTIYVSFSMPFGGECPSFVPTMGTEWLFDTAPNCFSSPGVPTCFTLAPPAGTPSRSGRPTRRSRTRSRTRSDCSTNRRWSTERPTSAHSAASRSCSRRRARNRRASGACRTCRPTSRASTR